MHRVGSIPGQGTKIPHEVPPRNLKNKQKTKNKKKKKEHSAYVSYYSQHPSKHEHIFFTHKDLAEVDPTSHGAKDQTDRLLNHLS